MGSTIIYLLYTCPFVIVRRNKCASSLLIFAPQRNMPPVLFALYLNDLDLQIVGIPMSTNCAPLLADLFLYSYKADL
jgi:hypothetical protein